jgi:hypothetical protein
VSYSRVMYPHLSLDTLAPPTLRPRAAPWRPAATPWQPATAACNRALAPCVRTLAACGRKLGTLAPTAVGAGRQFLQPGTHLTAECGPNPTGTTSRAHLIGFNLDRATTQLGVSLSWGAHRSRQRVLNGAAAGQRKTKSLQLVLLD